MFNFFHREMCIWDLVDGQCIESVKIPLIHSYIQVTHLIFNCTKTNILTCSCLVLPG